MDTTTTTTNHRTHTLPATPATTTWVIDAARSHAEFAVGNRVMLVIKITVNGSFSNIAGTITLDEENPANSRADVVIGAASLDTKQARRDKHLKSADFFDVDQHPRLTFTSGSIEAVDAQAGRYQITGDLTVRGIMRPVALDAQYTAPRPSARTRRITITGTTMVNRRDFGMGWGNAMTQPADEARLTVTIEATPGPAQGASSA